jgi:hypothetical protein
MDNMSLPERDGELKLFQHLMAQYDTPAYLRRACRVHEALNHLHARCRKQRAEWLAEGRFFLTELANRLSGWDGVTPFLASPEQGHLFPLLLELLDSHAPMGVRSASRMRIRRALGALIGWLDGFNARWLAFLNRQDLGPLNHLRDGYNRYYLLEKECALRSARLARNGFEPLVPYTMQDLLNQFPLLPVPLAGS